VKFKKVWNILRVFIGILLISFLLWRLDIQKILINIKTLRADFLAYAMVPYFFFIVVSAWRWQVLLDFKNFKLPFGRTILIYFIAFFFNNFLPTTVGGDVMRVLYSTKDRKADALAIVLVDRILGFVGLFIFALIAVLYLMIFKGRGEFFPFVIIGLFVIVIITLILFSQKAYRSISPWIEKIRLWKFGYHLNRLHDSTTEFGGAWGLIILCVFQSILIQALLALAPYFVLKAIGDFSVGILPFFIYVPIINIVSMIPVSFNALGVRENAYVVLFSRVGLSGEVSLTISLVSFFLIFLYSLLGGIFFLFYKRR